MVCMSFNSTQLGFCFFSLNELLVSLCCFLILFKFFDIGFLLFIITKWIGTYRNYMSKLYLLNKTCKLLTNDLLLAGRHVYCSKDFVGWCGHGLYLQYSMVVFCSRSHHLLNNIHRVYWNILSAVTVDYPKTQGCFIERLLLFCFLESLLLMILIKFFTIWYHAEHVML